MDLSGLANAQKTDAGKEQQGDKVNITFQAPSGAFEAEFPSGETIMYVKMFVAQKLEVPPTALTLKHDGAVLIDPFSICDCGGLMKADKKIVTVEVAA